MTFNFILICKAGAKTSTGCQRMFYSVATGRGWRLSLALCVDRKAKGWEYELLGMENMKVLLKIKAHSTQKLLVEEESNIV